jgi:hypothetical protein
MFFRCQAEPGGEVAARGKRRRIDLGRHSQRRDRTDPGYARQPLAERIIFVSLFDPGLDLRNPCVEAGDLLAEQRQGLPRLGRDRGFGFDLGEQRADVADALAADDTEFAGVTAQRIDQLGALTHQCLAQFQHQALRLYGGGLYRHEGHAGPAGGLADRFRVVAVVLAALHIGLDVLRRDQQHSVSERDQFRAQWWLPPQASIAIGVGGSVLKNTSSRARLRLQRTTGLSAWSMPCRVNTALDVSMAMRL